MTARRPPRWPLLRRREQSARLELVLDLGVRPCYQREVRTFESAPDNTRVRKVADQLGVPLRWRPAPAGSERRATIYFYRASDDDQLRVVQAAIEIILSGFRPYPAVVIDRAGTLIAANSGFALLTAGMPAQLRTLPVNLARLILHPDGLAGRITNLAQWRYQVLAWVAEASRHDDGAEELYAELAGYPGDTDNQADTGLPMPLRLQVGKHHLAFLCTLTPLGRAEESNATGFTVAAFLPADYRTARIMRDLVSGAPRW